MDVPVRSLASQIGWPASLFVRDSHFLDHARIFGELITRHDAKLFRRAAPHGKSQLFELATNFTVAERLENLGVQPAGDLLWRSSGSQHRKPGVEEEAGQPRFRNGGYIRKLRQPFLSGHTYQP